MGGSLPGVVVCGRPLVICWEGKASDSGRALKKWLGDVPIWRLHVASMILVGFAIVGLEARCSFLGVVVGERALAIHCSFGWRAEFT